MYTTIKFSKIRKNKNTVIKTFSYNQFIVSKIQRKFIARASWQFESTFSLQAVLSDCGCYCYWLQQYPDEISPKISVVFFLHFIHIYIYRNLNYTYIFMVLSLQSLSAYKTFTHIFLASFTYKRYGIHLVLTRNHFWFLVIVISWETNIPSVAYFKRSIFLHPVRYGFWKKNSHSWHIQSDPGTVLITKIISAESSLYVKHYKLYIHKLFKLCISYF